MCAVSSSYVVAVLFLVTVFNFMDRQILPILLEAIKRDLGVSDSQMGLLTGFAFVAFFALSGLPIARAADAHSRRNIIAISLAFWSGMTMLSGCATSFFQLALTRAGLGLGEAATAPAAQSMLSDLFWASRRTAALSLLAIAGPTGVMLAFIVGGSLQEVVGWRTTFVAIGAPGFALALLVLLTVAEPRRGAAETSWLDGGRHDLRETLAYLWSLRSLRYLAAGASLNLFCAWGTTVWSASFLIRVHGMSTSAAGAWIGIASGVGGIAGTLTGGLMAERLSRRDAAWQFRVPAVTSALAAPFIVLFLTLPAFVALPMYFAAAFFGACMIGPVLAITQSLAKVRMRALAAALVAVAFNIVGNGFGPLVVGVSSDLLAPRFGPASIRYAILAPVTAAMLAAAWCFHRGERHIAAELARATDSG
jgi:predicted MFS family arabinose efflux permease